MVKVPIFTCSEIVKTTHAKLLKKKSESFFNVDVCETKVSYGSLFISLQEEIYNGDNYILKAIEQGATGIMVNINCQIVNLTTLDCTIFLVKDTLRAYRQIAHFWRMKYNFPVVAVTGSNGKTVTKNLIATILLAKGSVLYNKNSCNDIIGLPSTLLNMDNKFSSAVVEVAMRKLHQIEELGCMVSPTVGVITNVGETHMEHLGSLKNVATAKAELIECIQPQGVLILNADDEYVIAMKRQARNLEVITYSIYSASDIRCESFSVSDHQTKFQVNCKGKKYLFTMPICGKHNIYNALAAISVAVSVGISFDDIIKRLSEAVIPDMRFTIKKVKNWKIINDAYDATPSSMKIALESFIDISSKGRKVAVLGNMINRIDESAIERHYKLGRELANKGISILITVGDMGKYIADGAIASGLNSVYYCLKNEEVIRILHLLLEDNDIVFFKGVCDLEMEKIIDKL